MAEIRGKYVYDDESIEDAARSMEDLQVRRLPVLNREKRLVGIVSKTAFFILFIFRVIAVEKLDFRVALKR